MPFPKALVLIMGLLTSFRVFTMEIIVGQTYPVNETSALKEIEQRVKRVGWNKLISQQRIMEAIDLNPQRLPRAHVNKTRIYYPFYTLEMDITDPSGNVLYPKGFKYNPLDYFYMPGRVVVIGHEEEDIDWLKRNYQKGDRVITAGGDVNKISNAIKTSVFKYDKKMRDRMGVVSVPSIVVQKKNAFEIAEYHLIDIK